MARSNFSFDKRQKELAKKKKKEEKQQRKQEKGKIQPEENENLVEDEKDSDPEE